MKKFSLLFLSLLLLSACNGSSISKDEALKVDAQDWVKGPATAKLTLVEFADFQCPACGAYYPLVKEIAADYPKDLRVIFRHFPLTSIHQNALLASKAAEAAGRQGKFWEMHDMLYQQQKDWSESGGARDMFAGYAEKIGANKDQFLKDLDSSDVEARVRRGMDAGRALGVNGTPIFFLNGQAIQPPRSIEDFRKLLDLSLQQADFLKSATPDNKNASSLSYHAHADLRIVLQDKPVDLSQTKYQSTEEKHLNEYVHLHDRNGEVVHFHQSGIRLADFFMSLGMQFSSTCFVLDGGDKYCNEDDKKLRMFVNGKENTQFDQYQPKDLDRILIIYGNQDQTTLDKEIAAVSDKACIYSEKCPERGKPPTESCVGGLGTNCEE